MTDADTNVPIPIIVILLITLHSRAGTFKSREFDLKYQELKPKKNSADKYQYEA